MFQAVAKADTNISVLIQQSLRAVGRTDDTEVTAFQHAAQTAGGLPIDNPGRMKAKSVIVDEVERLRWRIWNGKAKNAKRSIDRVRKVMRVARTNMANTRGARLHAELWHALLDVDRYLRGRK